jgi:hypothetical protein
MKTPIRITVIDHNKDYPVQKGAHVVNEYRAKTAGGYVFGSTRYPVGHKAAPHVRSTGTGFRYETLEQACAAAERVDASFEIEHHITQAFFI